MIMNLIIGVKYNHIWNVSYPMKRPVRGCFCQTNRTFSIQYTKSCRRTGMLLVNVYGRTLTELFVELLIYYIKIKRENAQETKLLCLSEEALDN